LGTFVAMQNPPVEDLLENDLAGMGVVTMISMMNGKENEYESAQRFYKDPMTRDLIYEQAWFEHNALHGQNQNPSLVAEASNPKTE
ncbi:hypothetical protein HY469_03460, partial [Candidatus Roizmanbacteria bacterium]|nr:hypothetical protein [Candidatus Roizmanbacteria bacterium]